MQIKTTDSQITFTNYIDHLLARLSVNRNGHRVEPGLYSLGNPDQDSPVFVSANYTLSFDELRSTLKGHDCYLLVLDTKGINVWCAAGKGTFSTEEIINRIEVTGLTEIVNHRKLIVPQLGAPGIAAHEVKKITGFNIEYGPVRAGDLPEFLSTGKASKDMRRVRCTLMDRLVLVPVEFVHMIIPMVIIATIFYFISDLPGAVSVVVAMLAGVALFPLLLPWIPSANFSTKGFLLGGILALPFVFYRLANSAGVESWQQLGLIISHLLIMPSVTAFLTLNFTGSTTFTSRSGVKREIFAYFPLMAWMFGGGVLIALSVTLIRVIGA